MFLLHEFNNLKMFPTPPIEQNRFRISKIIFPDQRWPAPNGKVTGAIAHKTCLFNPTAKTVSDFSFSFSSPRIQRFPNKIVPICDAIWLVVMLCVFVSEKSYFSAETNHLKIFFFTFWVGLYSLQPTNPPLPPQSGEVVVVVRSDRFRDDCFVSSNTLELLLGNDHVLRIDTLFPGLRHHHHLHV